MLTIPENVKIGQRWLYTLINGWSRVEEVISIREDRTSARVKIVQCFDIQDYSYNQIFNESTFSQPKDLGSEGWTLLIGQESPNET